MKANAVTTMNAAELVQLFVEMSIEQGKALESLETARFNSLFKKLAPVVRELRSRPGDQRHLLLKLYDHPDFQVKLNVAGWAYALDPEAAVAAFQAIKESRQYPWAGHAGMSLSMLEMGLSKLPEDPMI
jgi:hypothetical protein